MAEFPERVSVNTGGKSGAVLLVVGTLFVGYLYFTGRLPNVFKAIAMPVFPEVLGAPTTAVPMTPTPSPNPYKRTVTLIYPMNYNLPPDTIDIDIRYCLLTVFQFANNRLNGNAAAATAIAEQVCAQLGAA
jgi:hypothetical protein